MKIEPSVENMQYYINKDSVSRHLNIVSKEYDQWKEKNSYFYGEIKSFLRRNVAPGSRVLEIGCRTGDMLAATEPSRGVGIDVSTEMIDIARKKHANYEFICTYYSQIEAKEKFDYILLLNVLGYSYDVTEVLENVHKFCHSTTKIIITTTNPWWRPLFTLSEKLKIKMPFGPYNFIEKRNLTKIIEAMDFSINSSGFLALCPKKIPLLSYIANKVLTRVGVINKLSFVQYMVLRPVPENKTDLNMGCSVIIPCYNEAGNIAQAVKRVPKMGSNTEIIVVSDGSQDETADIVREMQKDMPELKLIDYSPNHGKGYAVTTGFNAATQDIIMILDADMSVMPEELPRFFSLLNKGVCDFVNGTRLIYPMQDQAMKLANLFGNKIFSFIMTFLTGQNLTDTLCGTKALYKKDYKRIKMGVDKWGDFDLLFGAAKNGSRILEVPVHYMSRTAGTSKMKALSHGIHLMKVCFRGFKELVLEL